MHFEGNFLNFLLDQLAEIEQLTFRKMLGGIGFYRENLLFGILQGGKLRLRSPGNHDICLDAKPASLILHSEEPANYCEVPSEVLNDKPALLKWAEVAFRTAKGRDKQTK